MGANDERLTLPNYPALPKCPKCGSIAIRQRYFYIDDTVEHSCGCNYKWFTLPLDDTIKLKKDRHDGPAKKTRK